MLCVRMHVRSCFLVRGASRAAPASPSEAARRESDAPRPIGAEPRPSAPCARLEKKLHVNEATPMPEMELLASDDT